MRGSPNEAAFIAGAPLPLPFFSFSPISPATQHNFSLKRTDKENFFLDVTFLILNDLRQFQFCEVSEIKYRSRERHERFKNNVTIPRTISYRNPLHSLHSFLLALNN